jgi:uncharacterized membrane protein YhaH (DUF805 family)
MFQAPFSFNERIRRTEFGISFISYLICATVIDIGQIDLEYKAIFIIANIPLLWFVSAQGAKRCHDTGRSGFWQLVPFMIFWLLFEDGQPGENEYGDNPKGVEYRDFYQGIKEEPSAVIQNYNSEPPAKSGNIDLTKN